VTLYTPPSLECLEIFEWLDVDVDYKAETRFTPTLTFAFFRFEAFLSQICLAFRSFRNFLTYFPPF